jgi:hypothetical protein
MTFSKDRADLSTALKKVTRTCSGKKLCPALAQENRDFWSDAPKSGVTPRGRKQ